MADEVFLTPDERLAQLSDIVLSSVLKTDEISKQNRQILFGQLAPNVFRDEYYIIYKVLYSFKEKGITPDEDFMRMYLLRNENLISGANSFINISAYDDLDENPVVGYTMGVLKQFVRLRGIPTVSHDDFKLTLEKYKLEYQCLEMGDVLGQAKNILYDGIEYGRKHLQGYDDSISFVKRGIAEIDSIIDTTAGKGFIDASVTGVIDDETAEPIKIGDFGLIDELNQYLGGIYTPNFYSIMAPTKGGKSKFTSKMVHNIAIEHGNNVVVWSHEGGYGAWLAQLRAIHFDWLYNSKETDSTKHKMGISQDIILKKDFKSEDTRNMESSSRSDLFGGMVSGKYGNIYLVDRPFKVETFIDELETAVQLSGAKAILIDYLQLIGWDSKNISKSQAVGSAYQQLLSYAKKRNVAVITPAQFTQEFMNEMAKSKDGSSHEVRTAGGESAEIVRTPDVNIALYASAEDLIAKQMKILSVPSRMAAPFPSFDIYCDLGVCMFASLPKGE